MPKHDYYKELCAAAIIGEAASDELFDLERHASQCEACRQIYFDFLNIASEQFAAADLDPSLSPKDAQECLNSELFTQRFFKRAGKEGIVFSQSVDEEIRKLAPPSQKLPRPSWRLNPVMAVAAAIIVAATVSTIFLYRTASWKFGPGVLQTLPNTNTKKNTSSPALDKRIAELTSANHELQEKVERLSVELRDADHQSDSTELELQSMSKDRQRLAAARDAFEAQLAQVQKQLVESQNLAVNAQQDMAKAHDHSAGFETDLVADEIKIRNLTEELTEKSAALDQERQLLALGHDVSDLMGARNLHIVDVVDTDPHGKTRPAFGRIFFTEGKTLLFYAYDLNNEAKIQKTNYQYRVWAEKEGQDKQIKSLGIFYSDDKAQRRWVFKCNDPKILSDIDSVFVTLEPANSDSSHPKGTNLMYAYLRGQPNHP